MGLLTKLIGTKHQRDIRKLQPLVAAINDREAQVAALDEPALRQTTADLKQQLEQGAKLDDLLVPAFAAVREASRRTLGMRHYDVQLIGGMVLHHGKIAEMRTGEGKTLVATLPVYLNALTGRGVHVVTVNDYLASRDAEWMGRVYQYLGLSVGCIQHGLNFDQRQAAYRADVTYATNNELGFDYLRDNMVTMREMMVQRGHSFAIVDEVDSILVDEARTPLIISGPSEESTEKYYQLDRVVPKLERGEERKEGDQKITTGDFVVDEKAHTVSLTEEGVEKIEKALGLRNLYEMENIEYLHGVNQALRAHHLYHRDVEYLIKDGQVVIVDEFTGRMMPGRRWSDGLHQAVEAKEGLKIERENQTLATITFQNYFRMYQKLAGMTGTAETEASEFGEIYKLDVTVIPTHRPMIRDDRDDLVYRTTPEKWNAVVEEIEDCQKRAQPVLVGTVSIETSEMLSRMLKRKDIPHVVLNAKYHEKEASIVAQAGRKGAVTIATNMAGRGTDILLGGNPEGLARAEVDPNKDALAHAALAARYLESCVHEREEVINAGGLHILGTERHEARRIDNQLRGRSGRQGDPGSSRFFLSLEDDLMRIFANERVKALMKRLGMEEGVPIEAGMVTRAIQRAQKQVEARNFEIRKNLLEYDDVMNKQREAIYQLRQGILSGREGRDYVLKIAHDIVDYLVETHCPERLDPRDWELDLIRSGMVGYFDLDPAKAGITLEELGVDELRSSLIGAIEHKYQGKETAIDEAAWRWEERRVLLGTVDHSWKDHLLALDHLKEGIGLRGYGQRDPKNEYKRESYELFAEIKERIEDTVLRTLFRLEPITVDQLEELRRRRSAMPRNVLMSHPASAPLGAPLGGGAAPGARAGPPAAARGGGGGGGAPPAVAQPPRPATVVRTDPKVGRNDPCPCGSGKKYKKCHGATASVP